MHVGPHDPIFAGGRRGTQGLSGGQFPGIRYDPTNPEGLEATPPPPPWPLTQRLLTQTNLNTIIGYIHICAVHILWCGLSNPAILSLQLLISSNLCV
jgi:hypothetical protein